MRVEAALRGERRLCERRRGSGRCWTIGAGAVAAGVTSAGVISAGCADRLAVVTSLGAATSLLSLFPRPTRSQSLELLDRTRDQVLLLGQQ